MATATRQESQFYADTLPNGLRLLGQYMPGTQSTASVFWVETGTRDEPRELMGVSHFLEHMAFKQGPHMSRADIDRAFEEMGAEYNAATWLDLTFYWARVLSENTSWAVEVLSELPRPALRSEDFESERKVILEEIARYEDLPGSVVINKFMEDYFGLEHPLSMETLGTGETIKQLRLEPMREYWQRRYGARNILFAIAGNFDWDTVVQQLDTLTRDWQPGESGRRLLPAPFRPNFHVYRREKFTQEQIALGTPSVTRSDPRFYAASVLATVLGDDTGSRLFWSLYQTGLAESVSASYVDFDDNGIMLVHISTEPGQAQEALNVARAEMQRMQDFDVDEDELERAKAKLNSSVIIGGESTNERVMGIIRSWLSFERIETLEEIREKIDAVTLEDLRNLVQEFPLAPDQVITAVGPLEEQELQLEQ